MSINAIYLRRAQKVILPKSTAGLSDISIVATAIKNLESLGYTFSKDVIVDLITSPSEDVVTFVEDITSSIKLMLGDNVRHNPMYPNFPHQVMSARPAELYINALLHYLGASVGLRILPVYEKEDRPILNHTKPLTIIEKGSAEDFVKLTKALMSSKVSFSEQDRADLAVVREFAIFEESIPTEIPNKENLAYITAAAKAEGSTDLRDKLFALYSTATDVLRYAVALSDGDISLATNTKFKKFKKADRRELLGLLNGLNGVIIEDMLRYKSAWKRLGEILHPGEYASRYPKATEAFAVLRNDLPFETFNSKTERLLKEDKNLEAAKHLSARPGEFARRLDKLFREADILELQDIFAEWDAVADKVSTSVLLQTRAHFANRTKGDLRVFFPKGNVAKFAAVEDTRYGVAKGWAAEIVASCYRALAKIYGEKESLGRVYVDPSLKGYLIPFGNRSASAGVKTLARGTRLPLDEDTKVVRLFTHWKNLESGGYGGSVDIDLSAGMLDENFKLKGSVTYYNLREVGGVHSGDITSAPDGASEFIDIDIETALKAGHRYVFMSILSYSRQSFSDIPELFAGFMSRNSAGSGEIYEPKTVVNKIDITTSGTNAVPLILDLKEREVVWTDMSMPSTNYRPNNVASNKNGLELLSEALITRKAPTMLDLFTIHASARGVLVDTREDADVVFALDGDITPFDTEVILSEYV
jgi:stress response protein SCP2